MCPINANLPHFEPPCAPLPSVCGVCLDNIYTEMRRESWLPDPTDTLRVLNAMALFYFVLASFEEVRLPTDGQTDRQTRVNQIMICYNHRRYGWTHRRLV